MRARVYFETFLEDGQADELEDVLLLAEFASHMVERKVFLLVGSFHDHGVILGGRYADAAALVGVVFVGGEGLEADDDFDALEVGGGARGLVHVR
jgi:hypothetical protein